MKILLVVHGYPPERVGGTETYTRNLARALKAGHDVAVFTRTSSPGEEYAVTNLDDEGVHVRAIRNTYSEHADYELHYRNPYIEPAFADMLDDFRPNVVHFTYMLGGLSASYLEKAADRKIRTVVTLTDFHYICAWGQLLTPQGEDCPGPEEGLRCSLCFSGEDPYAGIDRIRGWFIKRMSPELQAQFLKAPGLKRMTDRIGYLRSILKRADVVISPTKYMQDVYDQWGVRSRHIPFGIDKSVFDGFMRKPSEALRLGFIGRLLPLKGLHVLVEALREMPATSNPWRLDIYADDSGDEEKRYLKSVMRNAPAGVEFRGTFPVERIRSVYENMDALVLPSLWAENSPMALLFALHTKTPVIAADIGGVRELVTAKNACLYPPRDASALRAIISRIIADPAQLQRLEPVAARGMSEHVIQITILYQGERS